MTVALKSPEGLEEIIEDVEDILAHRMELALMGGWTSWKDYKLRTKQHNRPFLAKGAAVEVRFQYPGAVYMNIEVRFWTSGGWTVLWPDANEWWFPELEDEVEARASREANDRELKAY